VRASATLFDESFVRTPAVSYRVASYREKNTRVRLETVARAV
jgi:hypothetical protein